MCAGPALGLLRPGASGRKQGLKEYSLRFVHPRHRRHRNRGLGSTTVGIAVDCVVTAQLNDEAFRDEVLWAVVLMGLFALGFLKGG